MKGLGGRQIKGMKRVWCSGVEDGGEREPGIVIRMYIFQYAKILETQRVKKTLH